MWPFKKKNKPQVEQIAVAEIHVSQIDITEGFGDNLRLGPDDWIDTIPMNATEGCDESMGLPPRTATTEEVYRLADELSRMRESFGLRDDGVYCPICHIANISLAKLRTPCPKCGRPLLQFGWD